MNILVQISKRNSWVQMDITLDIIIRLILWVHAVGFQVQLLVLTPGTVNVIWSVVIIAIIDSLLAISSLTQKCLVLYREWCTQGWISLECRIYLQLNFLESWEFLSIHEEIFRVQHIVLALWWLLWFCSALLKKELFFLELD